MSSVASVGSLFVSHMNDVYLCSLLIREFAVELIFLTFQLAHAVVRCNS